jgi:hypothetical protein
MADTAVALNDLRHLLRVQAELRAESERKWQRAQQAMVGLLESFAAEEVERRLRHGEPLDNLPAENLVDLVSEQVILRLQKAQEKERQENQHGRDISQLSQHYERTCRDLQSEQENNRKLAVERDALAQEVTWLKNQLAALQQVQETQVRHTTGQALPAHQASTTAAPPAAVEPGWMNEWRQASTFERDSGVLVMIGETGLARRPLIADQMAKIFGIQKPGGSVIASFSRLLDGGWLEKYTPWKEDGAGSGGRNPDLLRLTEKGKFAYWLLTQCQPAPNEMEALLARHVTPEHTLLNLQAADILRGVGYEVDPQPPDIALPDGGLFKPDLLLRDAEGKVCFVEVEADAQKNRSDRLSKWHNFYHASGGSLYVVCDNRRCMKSIISELNLALGNRPATTHLTNLAELQSGQRGQDGSIWLQVRKRG